MVVVETAGFLFGIFMLYISYVSFKKKQLNRNDLIVWGIIWIGLIALVVFSQQLQSSVKSFGFIRLFDFAFILGFAVLSGIAFFQFRKIRALESKIDELVEKIIGKKK